MEIESLPMSEVGQQLTSEVDIGQLQISTAAVTTTPSPRHSSFADHRLRLADQPKRPEGIRSQVNASGVKFGLTGNGEIQEVAKDEDGNGMPTDTAGERRDKGSNNTYSFYPSTFRSTAKRRQETTSPIVSGTLQTAYRRYGPPLLAASIAIVSFLSPIIMVCLPLGRSSDIHGQSEPDCEGLLISLSVKLLILLVGTWALFGHRPQASLPRVSVFRALVLFSAALLTLSYWLFYAVRILRPGVTDYRVIVGFASSLVDSLLFVHYLAIVLLTIRPVIGGQFVVKIVRSPDGQARSYSVGPMSIQGLAVCCLQHYYSDFPVYSPYLERIQEGREMQRSPASVEYKLYSIDDAPSPQDPASPGADAGESRDAVTADAASGTSSSGCLAQRRRNSEEQRREWQRKLDRQRSKLIWATEEAFSRVTKVEGAEEGRSSGNASVQESSEAVYGWLSRPLHRYLGLVRQHPPYSKQAILDHISACITNEMSARSFLERYLQPTPVGLLPNDGGTGGSEGTWWEQRDEDEWRLVSDKLLNAAVDSCTTFELRRDVVSLLVTVREIPHLCLTQGTGIDLKRSRFVLEPTGQMTRGRTL